MRRAIVDPLYSSCGEECELKTIKGCIFCDPDLKEFASQKNTFFPEYKDQTMFIECCPKELSMFYPYVWSWFSDIRYSENITIDLLQMKFIQSLIYKTIIIDTDKCFNEKHNKPKKTTTTED